jgi:ABC-2 type transport system permease protein
MMAQMPLIYRANFALHFVGFLLQIFLLKMIWTSVYAGQETVDGIPLDTLIAYLTLANLQLWVMYPMVAFEVAERVRDGTIALAMSRPASFIGQMVARQLGFTTGVMPYFLASLPAAFFVGGLSAPASPTAAALFVISLALAYLIGTLIGVMLGLFSFWLVEIGALFTMYFLTNQFFAGAYVPLWFFPPLLRRVAELLPFQTQAFVPLAIYFGRLTEGDALRALGLQLFWVVALGSAARLMWGRAHRRLVVQGG